MFRNQKKIKNSIGKKVGLTVFIFSAIYFIITLAFGGFVNNQFELMSIVRKNYGLARTLSITLDQDYVTDLVDSTHRLYDELYDKYGDQQNSAEYLAEFDKLKTPQYDELLSRMDNLEHDNDIVWVNIHLEFPDTGKTCFILDSDTRKDNRYCLGWQSKIRPWKNIAGFPYEVIEDDLDGIIVMTEAPFYQSSIDDDTVIAYIQIGEKKSNLHKDSLAFILFFGLVLYFITSVFITISVLGINRIVVYPIEKLASAAESFNAKEKKESESHFFTDAKIRSHDEIRVLADSMTDMENDLYQYVNDLTEVTKKQERISAELSVASGIQSRMLPNELIGYNGPENFSITAIMRPAKEVGGDFYDFFTIDDDHIGITIADVSDKGVPAALFMVVTKTLIKNTAQDIPSPAAVLSKVNRLLIPGNSDSMFVTVFFGIYTVSERKLSYINAGHEDPALFRKSTGKYELILEEHDLVIGILEDTSYTGRELTLEAGDRLFLYTDGVPDAADMEGNAFGLEKMINCLNSHSDLTGKALLEEMQKELDLFAGEASQFDDITMLVLDTFPDDV